MRCAKLTGQLNKPKYDQRLSQATVMSYCSPRSLCPPPQHPFIPLPNIRRSSSMAALHPCSSPHSETTARIAAHGSLLLSWCTLLPYPS